MVKTGRRTKRRRWLALPAALLVLALAFWLYTADYYRADETARKALESDSVSVTQTDYGWFFDGPGAGSALIFYPGGKVEESAYAPLLHSLADRGLDVCLVRMPFHLAFFDMNAADGVMAQYDYEHWYIGGHSLGGAIAANYAASRDLDGVILLAAYPTKELDEPMLLLYGAEDGVVNMERIEAAEQYGTVETLWIEGGNHAGFGSYGEQKGDLPAAISPEEQQRITAEAILAWLPQEP